MSFGVGVGDVIAVGTVCWKTYKKCKESTGKYAELSSEVSNLYTVIKETEELLAQQGLTQEQGTRLATCRQNCEAVLKDLDVLLVKYESLGTHSKRTFDRMGFGMEDLNAIRLRIVSCVTMLDTFNNASSHARLETKLNLLLSEIRSGKREGSVISTATLVNDAETEHEAWLALQRELEDIGISTTVIVEKRQFIVAWFQKAIAAGRLEEDPPIEKDLTGFVATHDSRSPSKQGQKALSRRSPQVATKSGNHNEAQERTTSAQSSSSPKNLPVRSRPPQRKRKASSRASYLVNKLRGKDGPSMLVTAIRAQDENVLRDLLQIGVNPNSKDDDETPALNIAASLGNEQIVNLLLDNGANIDGVSKYEATALVDASDRGSLAVVRLLLDRGAAIESKAYDGITALIIASIRGYHLIVQELLTRGADVDSAAEHGETALVEAASRGHSTIVRSLLDRGADIEARGRDGAAALISAAANGNCLIVQLLIDWGADIEWTNDQGDTPLISAARNDSFGAGLLLLDQNAQIETRNDEAFTALMVASASDSKAMLRLLLGRGANTEARDLKYETALMKAVKLGSEESVRLLLCHGANIEAKDAEGRTAYYLAQSHKYLGVIRLLQEKGANKAYRSALKLKDWQA